MKKKNLIKDWVVIYRRVTACIIKMMGLRKKKLN